MFDDRSHIEDMLSIFRVPNVAYDVLMLKDSLDLTDSDREIMVAAIKKRDEERIIITHGTSTMTNSAEFIADHINNKTVVLTGALRPFSLFKSDCGFNLGCAMAAVQTLPHGAYITMNGQIFEAGKVQKNKSTGEFYQI